MVDLKELSEAIIDGEAAEAVELTTSALEEGIAPSDILNNGLVAGMNVVGEYFKNNEFYVPEVLIAARAMQKSMDILKPKLLEAGAEPKGVVAIGTVKGDLHDIGKNLVTMMLKGVGLEVYDVGVDVEPQAFIDKAEEVGADIICMSALLTTTMPNIQATIDLLKEQGLRDKYIVMVGGAPVNQSFADQVGADIYTADAASCAEAAKAALLAK